MIAHQQELFDPKDVSVPQTDLGNWRNYMRQLEATTSQSEGPRVSVDVHREKLLAALGSLAQTSMRHGLHEVATNPDLADLREERASRYTEGVFDSKVVPGAEVNKKKLIDATERHLGEAFGDLPLAYDRAWSDFSPEERAELIVDRPDHEFPDADYMSAMFRGKFSRKAGAQPRKDYETLLRTGRKPKRRKAS